MKAKTPTGDRSAKVRRSRQLIRELVQRHRVQIWDEATRLLAKQHPNGWAGYRWIQQEIRKGMVD